MVEELLVRTENHTLRPEDKHSCSGKSCHFRNSDSPIQPPLQVDKVF